MLSRDVATVGMWGGGVVAPQNFEPEKTQVETDNCVVKNQANFQELKTI